MVYQTLHIRGLFRCPLSAQRRIWCANKLTEHVPICPRRVEFGNIHKCAVGSEVCQGRFHCDGGDAVFDNRDQSPLEPTLPPAPSEPRCGVPALNLQNDPDLLRVVVHKLDFPPACNSDG